jgi:hypothetical protein
LDHPDIVVDAPLTRAEQTVMKLPEKLDDAQLPEAVRSLEAKGLIWSEIDTDGNLRFYTTENRPKPAEPDRGNVTTLANAARKRRRERRSQM